MSDDFVIEKPNGVAATPVVDSALGCSCERWSLEPEVPASGIVDVASEYNFPESGTYEARIRYNSRRQTAKDECYEDCDRAAAESNTVTIEITGDQVFDDDVRRFVNESKYRSFIGRIRQKRWWPFG